jgi:hypothetical protein
MRALTTAAAARRGAAGAAVAALSTVAVLLVAPGARGASATDRAHQAGLAAYLHGFPPVINRLSQATFPVNTLVGIAATATPEDRLVVMPNVDTAYTAGRLDLRAGPLVVHVPAMPDRYHGLQLMDAYTNVFGYVGTRTTGAGAGDYAIAGPGFAGALPPGMKAIRSPTDDVLLLGRTLVRPTDDPLTLGALLAQTTLAPLSAVIAGGRRAPAVVLDAIPARPPPTLPTGPAFVDAFNRILTEDPPSSAERRSLAKLGAFGIGAGVRASDARLSAPVRRAFERGLRDGPEHLDAIIATRRRATVRDHAGWTLLDPRTGNAGTDSTLRAIVARVGLWANTPAEATYPVASDDSRGRPLTGAHRYALALATPPPNRAFWSLTLYDAALHLHANRLRRYALGDRSPGLQRRSDGSTTIYLQRREPKGHAANWLPAPAGRFTVNLRIYIPGRPVLDGRWTPPGIVCLDCHPR